jgi:peptidyl-tRNA hydrolase
MSNIRHVVVVRKDLLLSPGLLAAQVAHISDQFMRNKVLDTFNSTLCNTFPKFLSHELDWMASPYLSVLAVNCAEDLNAVMEHAVSCNLQVTEWNDTIPSPTFPDRAIKVRVGISIGPDDFDKIKIVTGSLPLY